MQGEQNEVAVTIPDMTTLADRLKSAMKKKGDRYRPSMAVPLPCAPCIQTTRRSQCLPVRASSVRRSPFS
jgi:hypothetical protein